MGGAGAAGDSQFTVVDRGGAGVGVGSGEGEGAGVILDQAAGAGDDAAESLVGAAVDLEGAVIADVAGLIAGSELAGAADLEDTSGDRGGAGVGIDA